MAPKALFGCEKSPPVVPVPVLPNRLVDVPLAAPKPKPVLVDDVAGWLNVLDPNKPPRGKKREQISADKCLFNIFKIKQVQINTYILCTDTIAPSF